MDAPLRLAAALLATASSGFVLATAAQAEISVGSFTSDKTCTLYGVSSGKSTGLATAYAAASLSSWKTELVRDCVQNFPNLRATLSAALMSSGKVGGRRLTLTGKVMDAGFGDSTFSGAGVSLASRELTVVVEFQLKDAAGRPVFGGVIRKAVPLSNSVDSGFAGSDGGVDGTPYIRMEREAAFAVARAALFKIEPLRVVASNGQRVKLNYGSPLIPLGSTVMVEANGGLDAIRLSVTGAPTTGAVAESEMGVSLSGVPVGSIVTYFDADDPEASGTRHERVELPGN